MLYLLREERERELYETYTSQCLWILTQGVDALAGTDFGMPQYVEITHPEIKKQEPQTADEIRNHVIEMFGGVRLCS